MYNKLLEMGPELVGKIPGVGDTTETAIDKAETLAKVFSAPTEFPTDNAANTAQSDTHNFYVAETQMHVALAQSLIASGQIPQSRR